MQKTNAEWRQDTDINGDEGEGLTDAEYGIAGNSNTTHEHEALGSASPSRRQSSAAAAAGSSGSFISQKWKYMICITLFFIFIIYEIGTHLNAHLEDSTRVTHDYQPLVGSQGEIHEDIMKKKKNHSSNYYYDGMDDMIIDDDMALVEDGTTTSHVSVDMKSYSVNSSGDLKSTDTIADDDDDDDDDVNDDDNDSDEPIREVGSDHQHPSAVSGDGANENKTKGNDEINTDGPIKSPPLSEDKSHPRIACFMDLSDHDASAESSCHNSINLQSSTTTTMTNIDSIPIQVMENTAGGKSGKGGDDDYVGIFDDEETEGCKLSAPTYQAKAAAPSTCNEVHATPFRFGPSDHEPLLGRDNPYPSRHSIKYLTSGGFRSVWTITQLYSHEMEDRVIMKTNMLRRGWGSYYADQNRRDILIMEQAGGSPQSVEMNTQQHDASPIIGSNVLPVYQYCAFTSIVPFATAKPLDEYVNYQWKKHKGMSAEEIYLLALQAARGLYQMHLYQDGKATNTHADVKPPQFLLFDRPGREDAVPVLQLNDFNRAKFLTRNQRTNETCPFQMCNVHHKGSLYRSPEEYMKCADQVRIGISAISIIIVTFLLLNHVTHCSNPSIGGYNRRVFFRRCILLPVVRRASAMVLYIGI